MNLYLVIPLAATAALTAIGCLILSMGGDQRPNRRAALLVLGGAWWAFCELLWNAAPDAETALWIYRLSAPGWIFLAPFAVHLVVEVTVIPSLWLHRTLPVFYGVCGVFLAITWGTSWMLAEMIPMSWGWALRPGPLFAAWTGFTALGAALALGGWVRSYRGSQTEADRRFGPVVGIGMLVTCSAGFASDAILPLLGIQIPRFGTASMALLAGVAVWGLRRFGYEKLSGHAVTDRIFRTLPDGIALTSLNGRILVANDKLGEMVGCPAHELVGRPVAAYVAAPLLESLREVLDVECELMALDGHPVPVSVACSRLKDPVQGAQGVVILVRDLRAVAALRNQLIVSGRLAAVGQLAAGIAHEINNPLSFVRSNLTLLRREWGGVIAELDKQGAGPVPGIEEWPDLLDECVEGVDRASAIVRDVREFSHSGDGEQLPACMNELLDQVMRVAGPQIGDGVRIEAAYEAVEEIHCAPQRIKQLFLNLLLNAAQSIEGEGVVRVSTRQAESHVLVSVRDTGCGIAPGDIDRIFDPFFTTKTVGLGTGLGLSVAHEIVRGHGGQIWCESELGSGTVFHVRLPRTARDSL